MAGREACGLEQGRDSVHLRPPLGKAEIRRRARHALPAKRHGLMQEIKVDGEELLRIASDLGEHHETFEREHAPTLRRLADAANDTGRAWSGSNLGYHSCVYYADLRPAPPGAHFSVEWGLRDGLIGMGTRGDWREFRPEAVLEAIERAAGNQDLAAARAASLQVAKQVAESRAALISALTLALTEHEDTYLRTLLGKAEKAIPHSEHDFQSALLRQGEFFTRDVTALGQGHRVAPHQNVLADIGAINAPSARATELADIARQAGSHMLRRSRQRRKDSLVGTNVFIGHGRSSAWRELQHFVTARLGLPYDEFNRVPVAGITNITRLAQMLDAAAVALLVLTAEDERVDGGVQARMNVIHEVGLFQGRLGFTKAIVLLEQGCAEFTNIQGLGQIRFPAGSISAAFEEVRHVLEREGLIETAIAR